MSSRILAALIAAAALAATAAPALGHHSFSAEFDINKPVTLKGTITKMEWVNPHAWLYIDVKDAGGAVVPWKLEFGAPNALYRRGWSKDSLPVGVEVTVTGYRAKDGSPTANARDVVLADGKKLFAGSSAPGSPQ
jgi:hypothetical protein